MTVRFAKTVLFVLVATLLAVASFHCKLETIPALEFLACADTDEASAESHCEDEACLTVEDDLFYRQEAQPVALKIITLLPFELFAQDDDLGCDSFAARSIVDTFPLLPPSWQFVYRTALPARAPSLIS